MAYAVEALRCAMRSARSCGFFSPGNTILVPGMYFNQGPSRGVSHFQLSPNLGG